MVGGPFSDAFRTFTNYPAVADVLVKHLKDWEAPAQFIIPEKSETLPQWFKS